MKKLIILFSFLLITGVCQPQTTETQDIPVASVDSVAKYMNYELNSANTQLVKQTEVYNSRYLEGYIQALKYILNLMRQFKLIK